MVCNSLLIMSKYYSLFCDGRQIPALLWRIYLNIFGIFLRISILPMKYSFRWKCLSIWYKGNQYDVICKKGRLIYQDVGTGGEFHRLSDINKFWREFEEFNRNNLSNVGDFFKKNENI